MKQLTKLPLYYFSTLLWLKNQYEKVFSHTQRE